MSAYSSRAGLDHFCHGGSGGRPVRLAFRGVEAGAIIAQLRVGQPQEFQWGAARRNWRGLAYGLVRVPIDAGHYPVER
jgi:hypothetical protein